MPIQVSAVETTLLIVVCVIGLYYLFLYRSGILKPKQTEPSLPDSQAADNSDIIPRQVLAGKATTKMTLPPSIASPPESAPELEPEPEQIDETDLVFVDDTDSILLKEAEKVVERVQDTINHIASSPPNPEEVTSKIRAIVSPYKFLLETEYYDSINTYIALALERDCGMKLSPEELQSLWN